MIGQYIVKSFIGIKKVAPSRKKPCDKPSGQHQRRQQFPRKQRGYRTGCGVPAFRRDTMPISTQLRRSRGHGRLRRKDSLTPLEDLTSKSYYVAATLK